MDRVAFVTGGTRGIGLGCATAFLDAGYDVAIAARSEAHGRAVGQKLDRRGRQRCIFIPCDVGEPGSIESAVDQVVASFGRIDALVNNAASFMAPTPIDDVSLVQLREMLEVNVVGYFRASQSALPHLRATKGSIVNIGSVAGANGLWREAAYCLSKAAIVGLTKALAIEEAANGVRVNVVLPGNIMVERRADTEAANERGAEMSAYLESTQWLGRSGTPREVGTACVFLASDDASFITGADLVIGGGVDLGMGPKRPVSW